MPTPPNNLRDFKSFVEIVQALRGPEGCPWDKEQTHKTLTRYAIEETYELVEAIESGSISDMRDELGDVLLQVVLHSEISRQNGEFDINDVIESIGSKMVRRHPHVFARGTADGAAKTPDEVIKKWDEIKAEEKAQKKPSWSEKHAFIRTYLQVTGRLKESSDTNVNVGLVIKE